MNKTGILNMALDAIKGVKKVDLGDLTKKVNISDRVEAVKRMVGDAGEKVVKKADDWGWKGGKPGELTGGEFVKALDEIEAEAILATKKRFNIPEAVDYDPYASTNPDYADYSPYSGEKELTFYETQRLNALEPYVSKANKQLSKIYGYGLDTSDDTTPAMMSFDILEKSGIPREWTGRVYKAMGGDISPIYALDSVDDAAQDVSDAMRPLTNDQRETFVALLPEWTGTLDELAEAARNL